VVENTPTLSAVEMLAKVSSFGDISFIDSLYWQGITPSESVKVRRNALAS